MPPKQLSFAKIKFYGVWYPACSYSSLALVCLGTGNGVKHTFLMEENILPKRLINVYKELLSIGKQLHCYASEVEAFGC